MVAWEQRRARRRVERPLRPGSGAARDGRSAARAGQVLIEVATSGFCVTHLKVGDRVGVCWNQKGCGRWLYPLDEVNQVRERLEAGKVRYRAVLTHGART